MRGYPFSKVGLIFVLLFSVIGILYSGTLAYQKITTGVCAFGASCPYLLGVPVCIYGFFGFLLVHLVVWSLFLTSEEKIKSIWVGLFWFSLGGLLFALYYLIQELFFLPELTANPSRFTVPSCLVGFVMFGLIFISVKNILSRWEGNNL